MVVAKVNGYEIKHKEYEKELKWIMKELHLEEPTEKIKIQAINQLIDAILLLNEAKDSNLVVSNDEIESGMIDLKIKYHTEKDFEEMMKKMNLTTTQIRRRIKDRKIIKKYIDLHIKPELANISEAQLKSIFDNNQEKFKQESAIQAHHLLFEDDLGAGENRARLIRNGIQNIDDFMNMEKLSDKSDLNFFGGNLGRFSKGKMIPEFDLVVFNMKEGEISQPFKTQFGWHIVYIEKIFEARIPSFEEIKEIIKKRLLDIDRELKIVKHIKKIRINSDIEILQENIL